MAKEIEVQSRGEVEVVNNRKAKIEAQTRTKDLEAMIQNLYERLEVLEDKKWQRVEKF